MYSVLVEAAAYETCGEHALAQSPGLWLVGNQCVEDAAWNLGSRCWIERSTQMRLHSSILDNPLQDVRRLVTFRLVY